MSGETQSPPRRGLGRGLSALLGDPAPVAVAPASVASAAVSSGLVTTPEGSIDPARVVRYLPIEHLRPGKYQPRRVFDQAAIEDLVESVRVKGILQPILIRTIPAEPGKYEIIAGERRWRAAQEAQLHEVPVILRELTDEETLEVALIENLQRQDLSPLEEAEGYRRLMDEFSHTQEQLAKTVGKSRSHVANTLRLLALPDIIKGMLDRGDLTAGHARALLTAENPVDLAQQVVTRGLNVRQTEALAQQQPGKEPKAPSTKTAAKANGSGQRDPDVLALERDLSNLLGLRVSIQSDEDRGALTVEYGTLEQLDDILHRLSGGLHGRAAPPAGLED